MTEMYPNEKAEEDWGGATDEERALARLVFEALEAGDPTGYFGYFGGGLTTIDGEFNLITVARHILASPLLNRRP